MSGAEIPPWCLYHGHGLPPRAVEEAAELPAPPSWRTFDGGPPLPVPPASDAEFVRRLGVPAVASARDAAPEEILTVNAALLLRRPLLITGNPGTGKSSVAYKIARELGLGPVLRWPISSRTESRDGMYTYDAIGRVQAAAAEDGAGIGAFVRLGPLGTALLPYDRPRVLLIDELDKSDIDLPNDLLAVFEDGDFEIQPLTRIAATQPEVTVFTHDRGGRATVREGHVRCRAFPVVVVTSNGERDFPPAFLRRCLRLDMPQPGFEELVSMVAAHFHDVPSRSDDLIHEFLANSGREGGLANDQLLNAVHLTTSGAHQNDASWDVLRDTLWRRLNVRGTD
ncbi:ATP-binding protein [Amycolatopsis balhimycina DSM 5908]|uniref:ATP-binding protein n=1 Tax=Amycolatopsis balhimycina DSM 5908 TaxID=1081091 RepID=A0A428WEW8_AMYBA|nr:MoxR family ATPase [Amycolatopsis balhimycina]RSM41590.1 ATP-binding protein [Amycolatopsis balhimycina DSM 5908]